jgi:hypothetical protein
MYKCCYKKIKKGNSKNDKNKRHFYQVSNKTQTKRYVT